MPKAAQKVTTASTVTLYGYLAFNPTSKEVKTRYGDKTLTYTKVTLPATVERDGIRQPTTDFRFCDSVEVQDWGGDAHREPREGETLADFSQGDWVKIEGRLSESRWDSGEKRTDGKPIYRSRLRVEVHSVVALTEGETRALIADLA